MRAKKLDDVLDELRHAIAIADRLAEKEPAEAKRLLRAAARDLLSSLK